MRNEISHSAQLNDESRAIQSAIMKAWYPVAIMVLFTSGCGSSQRDWSEPPAEFSCDKVSAYWAAREFVRVRLKAPATADWSDFDPNSVSFSADTFVVHGSVDAQNSY